MINLRAILSAPLLLITWLLFMLSLWVGGGWSAKVAHDYIKQVNDGLSER